MSLDPPKSDAELLRLLAERAGGSAAAPRVALGPQSPLRPDPPARAPRVPLRAHAGPSEHTLQVALFDRVNDPAEQLRRPGLAMVFAIPNGSYRAASVAGRAKAEGQKPGVPDLCCPLGRGGYLGLWIEMKVPGGTTTPAQADWLHQLAREGHKVALHTSVEAAWAELIAYLDSPRTVAHAPVRPSTPPQ